MTTAALPSVDWIRFSPHGRARFAPFTLASSEGVALRLQVGPAPQHDECHDLLRRLPAPPTQVTVDLLPAKAWQAEECEATARRTAETLGVTASLLSPLSEFSLAAALSGVEPYNRMSVPLLTLHPSSVPFLDEDQAGFFVRVFTATARADGDGLTYLMRRTD